VLFTETISECHAFNDRGAVIGTQLKLQIWCQTGQSHKQEHAHQGYNVIKKVRMANGHAEPHRMVDVHDVDMEMVWTPPGQQVVAAEGEETHSTTAGNE